MGYREDFAELQDPEIRQFAYHLQQVPPLLPEPEWYAAVKSRLLSSLVDSSAGVSDAASAEMLAGGGPAIGR